MWLDDSIYTQSGMGEDIKYIEPIFENSGMLEIFKRVKKYTEENLFPVVDFNLYPVGVIRIVDLKKYVYSPFGHDILINREKSKGGIKELIMPCSVFDINSGIEDVLREFTEDSKTEGILITEDNEYRGVLSAGNLIKILNRRQLKISQIETIAKTAVTAHDHINTPLGVIIGRVTIISQLLKSSNCDKVSKNLDVIKDQAYRIKNTLDAMKNIKEVNDKNYQLDGVKMLDL